MDRFKNQVVLVTGSQSGIGRATILEFAREGADVVMTYAHNEEDARNTQKEIEDIGLGRVLAFKLDQSDPKQVENIFNEVEKELGTITILVNNAGINRSGKTIYEISLEEFDKRIQVDLYGPFYACREYLRRIEGTGKPGSIINVTSIHQDVPMIGASGYDSAKGGLKKLTETIALEVGDRDITVNNVAPGMILTAMNQEAMDDPEARKKQEQAIPKKRAGEPWEIAKTIIFLASPDARYIHGSTITIDGALSLASGQGA